MTREARRDLEEQRARLAQLAQAEAQAQEERREVLVALAAVCSDVQALRARCESQSAVPTNSESQTSHMVEQLSRQVQRLASMEEMQDRLASSTQETRAKCTAVFQSMQSPRLGLSRVPCSAPVLALQTVMLLRVCVCVCARVCVCVQFVADGFASCLMLHD